MMWKLMIVGLAGLAVGLTAGFAWRRFTLDASWAMLVAAWVDLDASRRQLVAVEATR